MAIAKRNYTDAEAEAVAAANSVPITRIISATAPLTVAPADGVLDDDLEIGISSATTGAEGAVELATVSETKDGADTSRAVTAAGVAGIVSLDTPATDGGIVKAGAGVLTLTAAANRSVTFPLTAAQTDAITTTADGDTNVSTILQSGANGDLRVDRLGVGVAVIAASGTIALPDAGYIGNGSATARLGFDSSGATDYAYVMGANFGIGTASPIFQLDVYRDSADATNMVRIIQDSTSATGVALTVRQDGSGDIVNFTDGGVIRLTIKDGGNVGINEPDPDYRCDVAGVIGVDDNVSDPSTVSGKATFYGKDVSGTIEAFAQDDAGNAAQLTAHPTGDLPFTPEPWEHISAFSNAYLGIRRYFRIEKALRDMEALTGEQYIYDVDIPKRDWHMDQAARGKRRPRPQWMQDFIRGGN